MKVQTGSKLRDYIFTRDNYTCHYCYHDLWEGGKYIDGVWTVTDKFHKPTIDHKIPQCDGGTTQRIIS